MNAAEFTLPFFLKAIPGYPQYGASGSGEIWSCRRYGQWRRLKPFKTSQGRLVVSVWDLSGERRVSFVHRLVLTAFAGPCPDSMECCHNDGNPANNRPENLRWDTRTGNMADTLKHGTRNSGGRNGQAKLGADEVRVIRERVKSGESQRSVARSVGVSQSLVSHIVNKKNWSHVA